MNKKCDNNMLNEMFVRQIIFQKRVTGKTLPATELDGSEVRTQVTAIIGELGEILEEYQGWKPWRKQPPTFDRQKLLFEIADLWHFVINLTLNLGVDEEELYNAFCEKNDKNHVRQDNSY